MLARTTIIGWIMINGITHPRPEIVKMKQKKERCFVLSLERIKITHWILVAVLYKLGNEVCLFHGYTILQHNIFSGHTTYPGR